MLLKTVSIFLFIFVAIVTTVNGGLIALHQLVVVDVASNALIRMRSYDTSGNQVQLLFRSKEQKINSYTKNIISYS